MLGMKGFARLYKTDIWKNKSLYSMAIPGVVLLFVFAYMPMFGIILPFKDFQFDKGIIGSSWVHPLFYNFQYLFNSDASIRAIKNTVILNALFIITSIICQVTLALLISEISVSKSKKLMQSLTLLPTFVSWVVISVFVYAILSFDTGIMNNLLIKFGISKTDFYSQPALWPLILVLVNIWKGTGYGAVIYIAVLAGIDPTYYEAATIDGATRWQQVKFISIPLLAPTVITLVVLAIGKIMNADFGMFYMLTGDSPMLYKTTDVMDTFVFRTLKQSGDIGMSSAAGFIQSVVSFLMVLGSNLVVRKINRDSALF